MGGEVSPGAGRLWVVSGPIGNLQDVTLRALQVLREADAVVAEDGRVSRRLLQAHGIEAPLLSMPAFDEARRLGGLLGRLRGGQRLALLTDAGTPAVSDPGGRLVAAARAEGIAVEVVPGASAVTAAVAASGLPALPFRFVGFLPRKGGRRQRALQLIAADPGATVFFEAPGRLAATLRELSERLEAGRRLAVCRELTKRFEEVVVGEAASLAERFAEGCRGEVTVVIEACGDPFSAAAAVPDAGGAEAEEAAVREALERLEGGAPLKEAARRLAEALGCSRREAYERLLRARRGGS